MQVNPKLIPSLYCGSQECRARHHVVLLWIVGDCIFGGWPNDDEGAFWAAIKEMCALDGLPVCGQVETA
ncbi:MAG: hypothetical protein GTN83_03190 [Acidobacteria bacterium]|nr:hypothetical protein [Acidobacteriota bacterium]